MPDLSGQTIGSYRIREKIGQGGMGEVYRGVDVNLDRTVAIKVLNPELTKDPSLMQRFQTEAKTQAQLNHPNICTLFSFLTNKDSLFMVMEYVEGINLEQMIQQRGPIPFQEAVPLFQQALAGLAQAHHLGIIHRDIKPSNFIVNRQGVVKVMDFGIARVLGASRLTRTGLAVGTLFYMSPEQIQGREVDFRTDIYSLGLTLYEMLTGSSPFRVTTEFEIMQAHVKEPPATPSKVYPYLPKAFDKIILKALEKNPAKRYATVEEFSQALNAVMPETLKSSPANLGRTVMYTKPGAAAATPGVTVAYPIGATAAYPPGATVVYPTGVPAGARMSGKKIALVLGSSAIGLLLVVAAVATIAMFAWKKKPEPKPQPISNYNQASPAQANSPLATAPPVAQPPPGGTDKLDLDKLPTIPSEKQPTPPKQTEAPRPSAPGRSTSPVDRGTKPRPASTQPAPSAPSGQPASPAPSNAQSFSPVSALQEKAMRARSEMRYIEPPGDNVICHTMEILKVEPANATALQLQREAVALVISAIQTNINQGNIANAKRLSRLLLDFFPHQKEVQDLYAQLQNYEEQSQRLANAPVFVVAHDHNGSFTSYCLGTMHFLKDRVVFQATRTTDGRADSFEVERASIKEVKKNNFPVGGFECFHIKLKNGQNFNFTHIDANFNPRSAEEVVSAYKKSD